GYGIVHVEFITKNVCCKRQSQFLPEENDKFLDKEERQALAAADTNATKDAIAIAEVSRKTIPTYPESRNPIFKSLSTMEGSCITSERAIYPRHTGNVFHSVATFFSQLMVAIGENTASPSVLDIEFRESANEQRRRMIEVISG
uniref:Uncharacterized protein n=1 Tax=Cucumis melo TaxID=3656 RepID=A0A9I9E849_CUCME